MNIRSLAFWSLDFLRRRRIGKHITEICRIVESFDNRELESFASERIQRCLEYATRHVPYYRDYQGRLLEEFPVVNKATIRSVGVDKFFSDEYLAQKENLIKGKTSGSTGIPFICYRDPNKRRRAEADAIYFNSVVGYELGKPWICFRKVDDITRKSALSLFVQNYRLENVLDVSEKHFESLARLLERRGKSVVLLGYASFILMLARYIDKHGYKVAPRRIRSVVPASEGIDENEREYIGKVFNAPVLCQYGCMETGVLAVQYDPCSPSYLLNNASFHFELLALDCDYPVPDNSIGRIVVTDFTNRATPYIRYDTGDLGVMENVERDGKTVRVLSKILGRVGSLLYNTSGGVVQWVQASAIFYRYPHILQYQVIQKDERQYAVLLNVLPEYERETEERSILEDFYKVLGTDAKIVVEYCDFPESSSGKRLAFVNEWKSKDKV